MRALILLLIVTLAAPAARAGTFQLPAAAQSAQATLLTPLTLESSTISGFGDAPKKGKKQPKDKSAPDATANEGMALGPERARILLRSLTVPGWGQASLGRRHAAAFFGTVELGIWTAFTAFKIQEQLRTENYLHTAQLDAGIDLRGRDDEFRRIVGAFASSDEYNLLVVTRDAANLYLSDVTKPDMADYRAYIAAHSLSGKDSWSWADQASFDKYFAQRKDANRAALRANAAIGIAIANRLVSALHAARAAGHTRPPEAHTWNFELAPTPGLDPTAFRAGVHANF